MGRECEKAKLVICEQFFVEGGTFRTQQRVESHTFHASVIENIGYFGHRKIMNEPLNNDIGFYSYFEGF